MPRPLHTSSTINPGSVISSQPDQSGSRLSWSPAISDSPYPHFRDMLIQDGMFVSGQDDHWRVACGPFALSREEANFFEHLGQHLLLFYQALNRLYFDSLKGTQPGWVHGYLDIGKPDDLLALARMNRFKNQLPGVIRPDLIPTNAGMALTELDSVP
ncbi:MAG: hypothetical protein KC592_14790, partial [Nitrospira sp.]|nr:hypothetical protein [Nitrospira sp.]